MFQKQPAMRRVVLSLAPIVLFSFYQYGLRALAVFVATFIPGILVEYLIEKKRGKPVSEAVLVTCSLYSLSMPPAIPLWIVSLGIVFAVFLAKEVYGGFGRNVFNPAIAGRLFVYISFATLMQHSFVHPGNFGIGVDALSGPTLLAGFRSGSGAGPGELLLGLRPGSLGEASSVLILLAAIYLVATKTAQLRLILSTLLSGTLLSGAFLLAGVSRALPLESLLAGSFLFVAVFMVTDPVSAPKKPLAQWVYGSLIGASVVLIRTFSLFPEGTSFAVLLGNSFASFLDELAGKMRKAVPSPAATGQPPGGSPAGKEAQG
jgi:Na+-transporting NADH:ubiquinone oxidoreductase subunit B